VPVKFPRKRGGDLRKTLLANESKVVREGGRINIHGVRARFECSGIQQTGCEKYSEKERMKDFLDAMKERGSR